jgi:ferrous-iron efflux pump FieF
VIGGATATPKAAPLAAAEHGATLRRRATYASVAVAALLIVVKLVAWLASGSVSVLSSLLDSLLDIFASTLNLVAVRHALTPADREHRFGHGKAEPLAGLGQAAFVAGSATLLLVEAVRRLFAPVAVTHAGIGIAVMVFSSVVTIGLVRYQRSVVRRTGSLAVSADELHYRSDLMVNGSVIVSLLIAQYLDWPIADPLFGIGIGLWILVSATQIVRHSLTQLMDRELPDEQRAAIRRLAEAHPEVRAVHDLRTRATGPIAFIQLHLELKGDMTLAHAHEVSDAVEKSIRAAYPAAEVLIHQDPEGIDEPRLSFPPKEATG